jgi:hypothetical protein
VRLRVPLRPCVYSVPDRSMQLYSPALLGPAASGLLRLGCKGLPAMPMRQALHDIIDGHTVVANSERFGRIQPRTGSRTTRCGISTPMCPMAPRHTSSLSLPTSVASTMARAIASIGSTPFQQSWFDGAPPMSTDLFHMYPTDAWVNQKRANWPYGVVGSPTWTSQNGSRIGPCDIPGCTGGVRTDRCLQG